MSKRQSRNASIAATVLLALGVPAASNAQTFEQEFSIFGPGIYNVTFDQFDTMDDTRLLISVRLDLFNVLTGEFITAGSGTVVDYLASYDVDVTLDEAPFSHTLAIFQGTTTDSFPPLAASLFDTDSDVVIVNHPADLPAWTGDGTITLVAAAVEIVEDTPPDVLEFFAGGFADFTLTYEYIEVEPSAQFDFDVDGDVDLTDFAQFQLCFTGPGGGPIDDHCQPADADDDDDVDLADFGLFQLAFTGPQA